MKKRIIGATFLTIVLLVSCCLPDVYALPYQDVLDSDWHTEAIKYVTAIDLM